MNKVGWGREGVRKTGGRVFCLGDASSRGANNERSPEPCAYPPPALHVYVSMEPDRKSLASEFPLPSHIYFWEGTGPVRRQVLIIYVFSFYRRSRVQHRRGFLFKRHVAVNLLPAPETTRQRSGDGTRFHGSSWGGEGRGVGSGV